MKEDNTFIDALVRLKQLTTKSGQFVFNQKEMQRKINEIKNENARRS